MVPVTPYSQRKGGKKKKKKKRKVRPWPSPAFPPACPCRVYHSQKSWLMPPPCSVASPVLWNLSDSPPSCITKGVLRADLGAKHPKANGGASRNPYKMFPWMPGVSAPAGPVYISPYRRKPCCLPRVRSGPPCGPPTRLVSPRVSPPRGLRPETCVRGRFSASSATLSCPYLTANAKGTALPRRGARAGIKAAPAGRQP